MLLQIYVHVSLNVAAKFSLKSGSDWQIGFSKNKQQINSKSNVLGKLSLIY